MRMDRISPRSSVTGRYLQSLRRAAGRPTHASTSQGWLRKVGGIRQAAEAGGHLRCVGSGRGAGALPDAGEQGAQLVRDGGVELGERVTDHPCPVSVDVTG